MSDCAAPVIVWFRNGLLVPQRSAACRSRGALGCRRDGSSASCGLHARRGRALAGCGRPLAELHRSLAALGETLRARGLELVLRRGRSAAILTELASATKAGGAHVIASGEPDGARLEMDVAAKLASTTYTRPGRHRRARSKLPASCSAATIRIRSSIMRARGRGPLPRTARSAPIIDRTEYIP
jgi:deoxyribodipyrimidine photolyase